MAIEPTMIEHHVPAFLSLDNAAMARALEAIVTHSNGIPFLLVRAERVLASGDTDSIRIPAIAIRRVEEIVPTVAEDYPRSLHQVILPGKVVSDELVPGTHNR